MQYPVDYIVVTQSYHQGKSIDFGWSNKYGGKNQPIYAIDDGVVWKIERQRTGGNVVYIRHDNGNVSLYAHLLDNSIIVFKNDRVKKGDKIALMGSSGITTGNHLHFGLYKNSTIVDSKTLDPYDYLLVYPDQIVNINTKNRYPIRYYQEAKIKYVKPSYTLNVRTSSTLSSSLVNDLAPNTIVKVYEEKNGWSRIGDNQWVSSNFLTDEKPFKIIYTKEVVNAPTGLNVRTSPNGTIVKNKAPLKNNTIVSILEEKNNWTKIGENRYVYSVYLK